MQDFSQHGEQAHILRYFGKDKGIFLDIGANDGRTFSNTHALALAGWSGLCVEPAPAAFASLSDTYANRPDIIRVEAAIASVDGTVGMQVASDTLVSSLDVRAPERWKSYGFAWTEIEVRAKTFDTLIRETGMSRFDFITIDAEGHDLDILRQIDLAAVGCRMLCIEHNGRIAEIKDACSGFKEYHRNGVNLVMGR